jgi:hypothetical protein
MSIRVHLARIGSLPAVRAHNTAYPQLCTSDTLDPEIAESDFLHRTMLELGGYVVGQEHCGVRALDPWIRLPG